MLDPEGEELFEREEKLRALKRPIKQENDFQTMELAQRYSSFLKRPKLNALPVPWPEDPKSAEFAALYLMGLELAAQRKDLSSDLEPRELWARQDELYRSYRHQCHTTSPPCRQLHM